MTDQSCAECGAPFAPTRAWSLFCCKAHKQAFHSRQMSRGHILSTLMQVHRRGGDGKRNATDDSRYAFAQACKLLDRFNAEDKAAGRRPDLVVAAKRASGWDVCDLA